VLLVPSERLTAIAGANTPVWPVRTNPSHLLGEDEVAAFRRERQRPPRARDGCVSGEAAARDMELGSAAS
jgi:hypothetical protein